MKICESLHSNRCVAECVPGSQVSVGMNRSAKRRNVKRFERSNRLDTALYKNIFMFFYSLCVPAGYRLDEIPTGFVCQRQYCHQ